MVYTVSFTMKNKVYLLGFAQPSAPNKYGGGSKPVS